MCEGCREVYGLKNEDPPCSTCRPEHIESNAEALEIFHLTKNQLVMSVNGPIDIMHEPIHRLMDMYNVKNKKKCFYKVLSLSKSYIESTRKANVN